MELAPGAREPLTEPVTRRPERVGTLPVRRAEDLAEHEGKALFPLEAEEHPDRAADLRLLDEESLLRARLVLVGERAARPDVEGCQRAATWSDTGGPPTHAQATLR